MITGQQCIAIGMICLFIGIFAGIVIYYYCGSPKCEHQWEKIIDERLEGQCKHGSKYILHTTVHMCKKCGKRKTTKV